ncbi:hypothetical protein A1O7_00227 [Cladophialophora yegresii CBS 114405]|uniref:Small ribosomal subunit protein uS7m n=1 Tax=Cladophialophora yegresii CBS 114405 TaxID=1182544 RepID=W9W738_9EURO|nr:uncharacterized protein A1O7_00227 [Cladophialophora yegresii CBS 114405]EXJ63892.1 hypothetical protein A1O7_00227 [Cladophialophora yegresii CBS 114405]
MAPRLSFLTARTVVFRPKPVIPQKRIAPVPAFLQQQRAASDDVTSKYDSNEFRGANESQLPHVTQEAAAIDKVTGNTPPDIDQGTPVQEILQRDKDAQEKAPEVLKQDIKTKSSNGTNTPSSGSRSFSTSARRNSLELQPRSGSDGPPPSDTAQFQGTRIVGLEYPDAGLGHKFPIPDLKPLGKGVNFKKRYDPVVEQVTRSLMKDGKLSRAQKNMELILDALRTSPAPPSNSDLITPLPIQSLPLNPVAYLTAIIDSVAPLIKIRQQRGLLGGGASMPIPVPLRLRQRRRTAIQWILASAEGRREDKFADRVAKELLSVAEGRSSSWEKRARVHKMAISARANIKAASMGRRVRSKSIRGK